MSEANLEAFSNGGFTFQIGNTSFLVHKVLVSRHSKALDALMKNGMKESQTEYAVLEDVDECTFARFVEFLYTGDYNPPKKGKPPSPSTKHGDAGNVAERLSMEQTSARRSDKATEQVARDQEDFSAAEMRATPGGDPPCVIGKPLPTDSAWGGDTRDGTLKNHQGVLLSHAQLYVFADKYAVTKLRDLAATRVEGMLGDAKSLEFTPLDVVEFVRYVYENTADRTPKVDRVRNVIAYFCASNITVLKECRPFLDLLQDQGQFAEVLVWKLSGMLDEISPQHLMTELASTQK